MTADPFEKATFAAGCFWGVEDRFRQVPGVISAQVGYIAGHTENPTYKQVCNGDTGHAEAVELIYDPAQVSYEHLLDVFWECHDPTTMNRQGPDVGSQYRSGIYTHTETQQKLATDSKARVSSRFSCPIVTEIVPASLFYTAEDYHQQYFDKQRALGRYVPVCH